MTIAQWTVGLVIAFLAGGLASLILNTIMRRHENRIQPNGYGNESRYGMRREDLERLGKPYEDSRIEIDRRFHAALGADVPSAGELAREILNDLSMKLTGVYWWSSTPVRERALIGDYLYQCAFGIEVNLAEAKLHYLEFLHARDKQNKRIAGVVSISPAGEVAVKMPASRTPLDDLPNKLESMHVCGFFQSIGSALDCLGGVIIGVLGLPYNLRKNDIAAVERAFKKLTKTGTPGNNIQFDFLELFQSVKATTGVSEWLEYSDQYRNMFIHRGRRLMFNQMTPRPSIVLDKDGNSRPITTATMHLVSEPDKSDAESFMHSNVTLNEDAEVTLTGIFDSCRDMLIHLCDRLSEIWRERRADPSLIDQPATQWDANFKSCGFGGFDPSAPRIEKDSILGSPIMLRRMVAAATDDSQRSLWVGSPWDK